MDFKQKLIEALGLDEGADDEAIIAALDAALKKDKPDDDAIAEAAQSALAPIGKALGLKDGADGTAILAAATALHAGASPEGKIFQDMQAELADTKTALQSLQDERKLEKAEAFVDRAIAEGRVGVKPSRAEYVALHQEDPARTEKLVNAMPKVGGRTVIADQEAPSAEEDGADDPVELAAQAAEYQSKLADRGQQIDFGAAVMAVKEGRNK